MYWQKIIVQNYQIQQVSTTADSFVYQKIINFYVKVEDKAEHFLTSFVTMNVSWIHYEAKAKIFAWKQISSDK